MAGPQDHSSPSHFTGAGAACSSSGAGRPPTLGFLGVGTLNTALVRGFLRKLAHVRGSADDEEVQQVVELPFSLPLLLSPRGAANVESLLEEFGGDSSTQLRRCETNADVWKQADVVFLGVRPPQVNGLLEEIAATETCAEAADVLSAGAGGKLWVNLVSTWGNAQLADRIVTLRLAGGAEKVVSPRIAKAVPLPAAQNLCGCTVVYAEDMLEARDRAFLEELFRLVGAVTVCESEADLKIYQTVTGLMGPFYQQLAWVRDWMREEGKQISGDAATGYLCDFYKAVLGDVETGADLDALQQAQTKGGLNEQAMGIMADNKQGTLAACQTLLGRLRKN